MRSPKPKEIDELVAFLPLLYAPDFMVAQGESFTQEGNTLTFAHRPYHPVVIQFFEALSQPPWLDEKYISNGTDEVLAMLDDLSLIKGASLDQVRTLLTRCLRKNRFVEGAWADAIKSGTVKSLLERLKEIRMDSAAESKPRKWRENSLTSVGKLEEFGRVRLSKSFFMREFLYSEISQIEGIKNIPSDPEMAIYAGKNLCEKVLEPLQEKLGHLNLRSGLRSCAVNERGAANLNEYGCSSNERTYANHIWDRRDSQGLRGATVSIIVNSFIEYYERTKNWQALAWWIHDNIPDYSDMVFYPRYAAFNISWHEKPKKTISSYIRGTSGNLTKPGKANFDGSHAHEYAAWLSELEAQRGAR